MQKTFKTLEEQVSIMQGKGLIVTDTKEAEDMKADTSKGKYDKAKDLYYFYDLTYDVDNEKTPTPPLTGGFENWLSYLPIVLAMALFIGLGIYQMKKRNK